MAKKNTPNNLPSAERVDEYLAATLRQAPNRMGLRLRWVQEARELTAQLAQGNYTPERDALFHVRLYGVLVDIWSAYREPISEELQKKAGNAGDPFLAELRQKFINALDNVRGCLSDAEMLYVELRRLQECHPILRDLEAKFHAGNDWNTRAVKILGKQTFDIDDLLSLGIKLETDAGGAEQFGQQLARKLYVAMNELENRMLPLVAHFAARYA